MNASSGPKPQNLSSVRLTQTKPHLTAQRPLCVCPMFATLHELTRGTENNRFISERWSSLKKTSFAVLRGNESAPDCCFDWSKLSSWLTKSFGDRAACLHFIGLWHRWRKGQPRLCAQPPPLGCKIMKIGLIEGKALQRCRVQSTNLIDMIANYYFDIYCGVIIIMFHQ